MFCMLVALGKIPARILIDNMQTIAEDKTIIHEHNEQRGLGSWAHKDGWGIAYLQKERWIIKKSIAPFFEDKSSLQEIKKITTSALILHVRKASGSSVALRNTHPFFLEKNKREYVFCHNGDVNEKISYHPHFVAQGETDSEQLFYSILTAGEKYSLWKAIQKTVTQYTKKRGTNIILSTKDKTYVGIAPTAYVKYYTMSFTQTPQFLIVSSEPLQELKSLHWENVLPGTILEIDNKSRKIKKYPVE
ncbi:class II glutamine amidotransferase [Candidatus Woesearchaeota archaeon]|nr:class II glutamine amidotransferase [Candidatus Woesearchaeota archaeon]